MAKKKRNKIGLQNTETKTIDYVLYHNDKPGGENKKLELKKYSKQLRRHVLYKTVKIK